MEEDVGLIRRDSRLAVFEHVTEKERNKKCKKFKYVRFNSEDSSQSESEFITDECNVKKSKKHNIRMSEEQICLRCDWNNCGAIYNKADPFDAHLRYHISDNCDENLHCLWINCELTTNDCSLFYQHVTYHGYIAKLINIGQNVLDRNKLPECKEIPNNIIPINPDGYTCEWEECTSNFQSYCIFLNHVKMHTNAFPRIATASEIIKCYWGNCKSKFSNKYKLAEHVRTHTKERLLACPTCFKHFSTKTKFSDHRRRQLCINLQRYQCSQCLKLFPTERILRDHIRSHINHYKCTMCDMTCSKPSVLAKHIRFKHLQEKHFKCNLCDKSFVTKQNLKNHLTTHKPASYKCLKCEFECRTKFGLEFHEGKVHNCPVPDYECHCCKKKFKRGGRLTRHFIKVHKFHWPSGHSRFRYRRDQDGVFRLQTVRYESLEVTEEMLKAEVMKMNNTSNDVDYTVKYDKQVLMVSVNIKDQQNNSDENGKDVFITINDVDEHGNILKSEIVKSKEIILDNEPKDNKDVVVISNTLPNLDTSSDEDEEKHINYSNTSVTTFKSEQEGVDYKKDLKESFKFINIEESYASVNSEENLNEVDSKTHLKELVKSMENQSNNDYNVTNVKEEKIVPIEGEIKKKCTVKRLKKSKNKRSKNKSI